MRKYAYRIYKNALNNPVVGGTVSGNDMEHATQQVIKNNRVEVVHEFRNGQDYHYFMLNNARVGILVYVRPEDF